MSTIDAEMLARSTRARTFVATRQFIAGLIATGLLIVQLAFEIRWEALVTLQADTLYQQLTGLLLALFIAWQFSLGWARMQPRTANTPILLVRHKWQGVCAPLLFYLHSSTLGYAYTLVLSSVFLANGILGLFNADVIRIRSRLYVVSWMVMHAALAVLTVALTVFHTWVVLAY